ncbi:TAFII28-domain-containing protein [Coniochaeta ligniaria NRRL 30616]|uniref:TAFII28-domain-containing protein n=1 Tax=Coniochaeta ligniaria NRRL 30616 TaxID=1408157 RepID=A0A1J7JLE7_9PEZI|nr:TAFII28-domain-containing protein [Coniochaeta ligniaria NRRL 30616]
MASSPPYSYSPSALPPPPSQSFSNSKKRTSDSGGALAPALKRRKASTMSATSAAAATHPLRQTSFPPDESSSFYDMGMLGMAGARSPSVDSMSLVSGSQVTANQPPLKKKRGRKSKAEKQAAAMREQTPASSVVGDNRARTVVSGVSGDGRGRSKAPGGADAAGDAEEDENIELDRAEVQVAATAQTLTAEQKEEEHRLKNMLVSSFSPDQFERYENWRASGFTKGTVRKLVNATVSQSVPDNVVLTVRTAAKLFIGDIIEAARRVQGEWIDKTGEKQVEDGLLTPEATPDKEQDPTASGGDAAEEEAERVRKWHRRGPLRPDHLREALRRYKLAQEGGCVGLHDPWHQQQQSGVERFGTRTQGRRLFK